MVHQELGKDNAYHQTVTITPSSLQCSTKAAIGTAGLSHNRRRVRVHLTLLFFTLMSIILGSYIHYERWDLVAVWRGGGAVLVRSTNSIFCRSARAHEAAT